MADSPRELPVSLPPNLPGMTEELGRLEPLSVPFTRFGGIMKRHYWILVLTTLLIVGGTCAVVLQIPKYFTADAILLIEPRRTPVSDLQAISADPGDITSLMRTQIDILNSPSLLMSVVRALHLESDPAFMQPPVGPMAELQEFLHRITTVNRGPGIPLTEQQKIELAAVVLSGKVAYSNEMRSSVLHLMVTTQNPALSARIANQIATQFLAFKRQEKFSAMQHADDWFRAQLAGLADQLHTTEIAIEQYKTQHGLIDLPSTGGTLPTTATSLAHRDLDEVASQLVQTSREVAQKEASLAQAKAAAQSNGLASLPDVLTSPVIATLLGQETAIAARAAQLSAIEGPHNPELMAVRAQLRRVEGRIAGERSNIVQSLIREVDAAQQQQRVLRERVQELRQRVSDENQAEVGLRGLLAKARATRSLYDSFLTRATELSNTAGIQEPDASLVSRATPPLGPSGPQRTRFIAVSVILSLVTGIGLACLVERLRGGFASPEQLAASLGIRTVALIPSTSAKSRRPTAVDRRARQFRASFDNFRGYLLAQAKERPKVILITSALPQEGKSVAAAAIAHNAAAAGWRVLLLECDFRRPVLAKQFNLPASPGLSEILTGRMLGGAYTAGYEVRPGFDVLPSGIAPGDPQELLASERMTQLLAVFRDRYDLVLLDTPPVIPASDALVLCRRADATLMLVRWEKTPRAAVQDAFNLLRDRRAALMGVALTQVDLRHAAHSAGRPAKLYEYSGSYHPSRL